ncbi:hypothetical protein GCM10027169_03970 [Gordonia jinhuaensis]|uniref:Nucleoside triphosphate pyrophosphatase n=1 Tax=Gordonia jinhuaensis TaxID=1517702 RepID=A0A916WN30_9ACTN|nr:nucleoside triphosphate pyrophosphatase [Gordonia jinhuaensis]GGB16639.1 hypothetical protein GCM10011489_00930 [Gordonia jinhuaensis]
MTGPGPGRSAPVLVLASASPARRRLLQAAGIDPVVAVSHVDEDALVDALPGDTGPAQVVAALAEAKAREVFTRLPSATDPALPAGTRVVVIGCDSMLAREATLSGKPHTAEVARRQWRAMRGETAQLITGHCLILGTVPSGEDAGGQDTGEPTVIVDTASTDIVFGSPTDAQIDAYVDTGEPLEVAGAFTLDGLGGWFIERIDGDPSSVIGLSLPLVRRLADTAGVDITELWNR